ncbi:hypothetical protein JW877_06230 [bacterium]|nr:hypothetical protein [bacterium]
MRQFNLKWELRKLRKLRLPFLYVLIVCLGLLLVEERVYILESAHKINQMNKRLELLESRNNEYKLRINKLASRERIKKIVQEKEGLKIPDVNQVVTIEYERDSLDGELGNIGFAEVLGKLKNTWDRITFSSRERKSTNI